MVELGVSGVQSQDTTTALRYTNCCWFILSKRGSLPSLASLAYGKAGWGRKETESNKCKSVPLAQVHKPSIQPYNTPFPVQVETREGASGKAELQRKGPQVPPALCSVGLLVPRQSNMCRQGPPVRRGTRWCWALVLRCTLLCWQPSGAFFQLVHPSMGITSFPLLPCLQLKPLQPTGQVVLLKLQCDQIPPHSWNPSVAPHAPDQF